MECVTYIKVRYAETDMMGIVHHSRYYPWFEVGRCDFIKQAGISYSELEKMGLLLPLAETHAKYIQPLRYDDDVKIITRLSELGASRFEFEYDVYRGDELCAQGKTVHALTDRSLKPCNLKKYNRELWDRINGLADKKN